MGQLLGAVSENHDPSNAARLKAYRTLPTSHRTCYRKQGWWACPGSGKRGGIPIWICHLSCFPSPPLSLLFFTVGRREGDRCEREGTNSSPPPLAHRRCCLSTVNGAWICSVALLMISLNGVECQRKRNVLLLVADDLRPELKVRGRSKGVGGTSLGGRKGWVSVLGHAPSQSLSVQGGLQYRSASREWRDVLSLGSHHGATPCERSDFSVQPP